MKKKELGLILILALLVGSCISTPAAPAVPATGKMPDLFDQLDPVIEKTFDNLSARLSSNLRIALLPPGSTDKGAGGYVFDELYIKFINSARFNMVDRANIDRAIAEIDFGLTGLVSDDTAASLGKLLGAQVIAFGDLPEIGTGRQRLVYRALEVETGKMLGISSERF